MAATMAAAAATTAAPAEHTVGPAPLWVRGFFWAQGLDFAPDFGKIEIVLCSTVCGAPGLGAGRSPFKPKNTVSAIP